MVNKYCFRSRISETKFREIIRCFSVDLTSVQIAKLTGVSRVTVNRILIGVRQRIAEECERQAPFSAGEFEVDESYFGARRKKGKSGRGAYGKTIVFGIIKRQGNVYTKIVPDCSKATLQAVIRGKVHIDSVIHSDSWKGYNGLVDVGYKKHLRIKHSDDQFADNGNHINGIESFWGFAKMRLMKFRGMNPKTFYLHLKECEFRFNNRNNDIYKILLILLRNQPLNLS